MTEARAFAAMVAAAPSPSHSRSSSSSSSSSKPSAPSLSSSSTLSQLWSSLPFLSSTWSPSPAPSPLHSSQSRSHAIPSCSTRTCLARCCSAPDPKLVPTSSPFNLRPKNYYSRRQRIMSSSPRHSSPSSVSHSDSGSDMDDLLDSSVRFAAHHQQSPLYKRSSHSTNTRTAAVVTASSTEPPTKRSTLSAKDAPLAPSSGSTTATTIPGASTKSSRLSALSLVADGPYLFVFDVAVSLYYPIRAMILFVLGFAFSLIIDHLQTQHQLVEYPNISGAPHIWDTASWVPLTCGAAAVLIGTIYPLGDYLWWGRRVQRNNRDWSSVMRCMGGFIGVNYAASKLPWTSSLQVSCTLALISAGLWFLFDRTFHGFMISLTVASLGTTVAYFLVLNGWYSFTRADFFGVGSWMPCILYSSSVCFGSIGRQLDVVPETWYRSNGTDTTHRKSE